MDLKTKVFFDKWLSENGWTWVVGMNYFINEALDKKTVDELYLEFIKD